jgi:predicted permease
MMKMTKMTSSRFARWLITRIAPADWRDSLAGDLAEGFTPRAVIVSALRLRWDRRRAIAGDSSSSRGRVLRAFAAEARHALHSLVARPATSALALATLTVGIGVTTSVFSLANWMLFRPIPGIGAPQDLVTLRFLTKGGATFPASGPDVGDVAKAPALQAAAGVEKMTVHVAETSGANPRRLDGEYVSTNYFDVLKQRLSAGRAFTSGDEAAGAAAHVMLVSAEIARGSFGGATAAVGQRLLVDRVAFEIVGVAASGFHGPSRTDTTQLWIPITSQEALRTNDRRISVFFTLLGRLRPGASIAQARDQIDAIQLANASAYPKEARYVRASLVVEPGIAAPQWERESLQQTFLLIWGVVALLLLLTCANVGNLMLARSIARAGELSTRQALGASRSRVMLGLFLEALWLSLGGGTLALIAARLVTSLLEASVIIRNMPALGHIAIEWRVFAAAFAISTVASIAAGLLPAFLGSRTDLAASLRSIGRGQTSARRRLRTALVVAQVAVTITLAIGGLLLLRSMQARAAVPLGFRTSDVLAFSVDPGMGVKGATEGEDIAFFQRLLTDVRQTPGVAGAGLAWIEPFKPIGGGGAIRPADSPAAQETLFDTNPVSPGFFDAIGLPILAGRDFTAAETFRSDKAGGGVVILNAALARAVFGTEQVVGRRVLMSYPEGRIRTIVGVVGNSRTRSLSGAEPVIMYEPFGQSFMTGWGTVHARLTQPASIVVPRLKDVVRGIDPMMPIYDVELLRDALATYLAEDTMLMRLTMAFAGVALLLAAVGLYGVLARQVEERRHEFGVRLALGAKPGSVARLVTTDAIRALAVGLVAGGVMAAWLVGLISSRLFGVTKTDPVSIAAALAVVTAATMAAAAPAARRAAKVDPADVLRR